MEIKTQLSGSMVLLLLLLFTNYAQACYYEGDPVWMGNDFDVPTTVNDISCYYSGDPVQIAAGQYDNPTFFAENSYYTADEKGVTTHAKKEEKPSSEFSAFEDQDIPDQPSKSANQKNNNTQTEGKNDNWTPGSWDLNY